MASAASLIPLQAMRQPGTSSTTRPGDPFDERYSENQVDQRSVATDTPTVSRNHGDTSEPFLSEQWEYHCPDLHLSENLNDEHTSTAALHQLVPSESTLYTGEQNVMGTSKNQSTRVLRSDVVASVPVPCRKTNTRSSMGQMTLDLCIAATPICFIVLAVMAVFHSGRRELGWGDELDSIVQVIMNAARFGPTVWLIMFAAILGRFLTSLTAWRLERGVDIAAVEYLTGSRTVFGTISTPFRPMILHRLLPLLLIIWSFSPLGGQASLRTVYLVQKNVTNEFVHMNSGPDSITPFINGASARGEFVKKTFIGALLTPFSTTVLHQDFFGNLKVPLLEAFNLSTNERGDYNGRLEEGSDGCIFSRNNEGFPNSALLGLVTSELSTGITSFLNIETSYMYSNCSLKRQEDLGFEPNWDKESEGTCNNGDDEGIAMALDADHEHDADNPSTGPRRIWFRFQDGTVECSMTTTYVEMNHICEARECVPGAVRRSRIKHTAASKTWLDGELKKPDGAVGTFCSGFISAVKLGTVTPNSSSILEHYSLDTSLGDQKQEPKLADIDDIALSKIITRLLNTYALAYMSPDAINRGTVRLGIVTTDAIYCSANRYLKYDPAWLVVLVAGSLIMFAAGIATVVLNSKRRGPEVLDSFTSLLKDNPYVSEETGPSTEDSSEKVRRLRKTRVMLGDVNPLEATGHVAVTTRTDGDGVQPLRSGKLYY